MDGPLPTSEFQARDAANLLSPSCSRLSLTLLQPPPLSCRFTRGQTRRWASWQTWSGCASGRKAELRVSRSLFTSLTHHPRQAVPPARDKLGARLSFSLVYPDRSGKPTMRPVGYVQGQSARGGGDDAGKTLHGVRFQTGDYLDVAILEHRT